MLSFIFTGAVFDSWHVDFEALIVSMAINEQQGKREVDQWAPPRPKIEASRRSCASSSSARDLESPFRTGSFNSHPAFDLADTHVSEGLLYMASTT